MKKTTAPAKSKAQKKTVTKVAARRVSALPAKKTVKKVASKPAAKPVARTVKKVTRTPSQPTRLVDNSAQGFMVFLMIAVVVLLCFFLIANHSLFKKPAKPVKTVVTTEVAKAALTDNTWVWVNTTLADGEIMTPTQIDAFTITFNADGSLAVTTDCNDGRSSFTDENGILKINSVAATLKYCMDSQETVFNQQLGEVESYTTTANSLTLNLADGAQMTFAPQTAATVDKIEAVVVE